LSALDGQRVIVDGIFDADRDWRAPRIVGIIRDSVRVAVVRD
jgi:hypothetical protein